VHAGRSRNDQVAVATRLWAKDAARELALAVAGAQEALVTCARANEGLVLPGYTHLQRAQPVLLGHHLAAHAWMLERDAERLRAAYSSADECPLGAGALAGSSLPLDPQWTAAQLGFARSFDNTLDAVADRDFICDLLYACALGFVHLSRLAEEVIVFTTQEFAFAQLDDTIALGSSMMPQKKNPQVAEHLRGRAAVAVGRLTGFLAVLKGLPLAYDSDLQEDKEALFAQVAALDGALEAAALLVSGLRFDAARAAGAAGDGWCVATDVAEALVRDGVPFREAHDQVAGRVAAGERFAHPTPEAAVAARSLPGGTSPERVAEQLAALDRRVADARTFAAGTA
jgi:argininosuccinate lyase